MDCKHVDALLMDYLYQELDPNQAEHVEAHLKGCARCADELSSYERTRTAMRALPDLEPSGTLDEELLREAARAVRLQPDPAPGLWHRIRESMRVLVLNPAMTAAVTLVVVLGISFVIYRNSPPPGNDIILEPAPPTVVTESGIAQAPGAGTRTVEKDQQSPPEEGKREETSSTEGKTARLIARASRDENERAPKTVGRGRTDEDRSIAPRPRSARYAKSAEPSSGYGKSAEPRPEPALANRPAGRASTGSPYEGDVAQNDKKVGLLADGVRQQSKPRPPAPSAQGSLAMDTVRAAPAAPAAGSRLGTSSSAGGPSMAGGSRARGGGGLALKENMTVYKKSPHRGAADRRSLSKADDLDALRGPGEPQAEREKRAEQRGELPGKNKLGQAAAGKQALASRAPGSAEHWLKEARAAQQRGDCSRALAYYERALELEPKLAGSISSAVRSCAATLDETALAQARKQTRRLGGMLNVEVARRMKARSRKQVDLEAEAQSGKGSGRKAKAAKPAKTETVR